MENQIQKRENTLPKLEDLFNGSEELVKQNALNVLLNQSPPKEWIKEHPFISKLKYLPINRIEYLLTAIFIEWHFSINDVKLLGNSIVVTGTLYVTNPITGKEMYQDGIGASPLQTDQGAGAIEFNKLKSGSVMMAAPAAESYAIKDAAEKFGKIFGKDLNRKDNISYDSLLDKYQSRKFTNDNVIEINNCNSIDELELYIDVHPEFLSNSDFLTAFNKRKDELSGTN